MLMMKPPTIWSEVGAAANFRPLLVVWRFKHGMTSAPLFTLSIKATGELEK